MTWRAAAAALALAAAAGARGDEGGQVFLTVLRVESAPGLDPGGALRATIELNPSGAAKIASLREWFPRARVSRGRVEVALEGRAPAAHGRPAASHRRASFLVDFDRPELRPLAEQVASRHGAAASLDDLSRAVDGWIERKSLGALVDVASTVATRREGDCSEHAVLLAALARLRGRAARVVFGAALVPADGKLLAFGHAWTEIHDGRAWRTVDAIPLPAGVRYLPMGALADEGPGYLAAAWGLLSPIDVRAIALAPATSSRASGGAGRRASRTPSPSP